MNQSVLALDIGGANIKAAHGDGLTRSIGFALWKNPAGLAPTLAALFRGAPRFDVLAVTMTGELCDCFASKREGVHFILDAVAEAGNEAEVRVWRNDGALVDLGTARASPLQVAAANWLALAEWVGQAVPEGDAILLDIGSTTTDIIPLRDGQPVPRGRTDPERLRTGELVYVGVRRTPLCALYPEGATEFFATTGDLYVYRGQADEDAANTDTADGRPMTREAARARLMRMMCADAETCTPAEVEELADLLDRRLRSRILEGIGRSIIEPLAINVSTFIIAGEGEFLARELLRDARFAHAEIVSLADRMGVEASKCACAYALAQLVQERLNHDG